MDKNEIRKTEHMYSTIQIGETVFSQFEKKPLEEQLSEEDGGELS